MALSVLQSKILVNRIHAILESLASQFGKEDMLILDVVFVQKVRQTEIVILNINLKHNLL